MKVLIAVGITALITAGAGFATATALDPRVPGVQRQVHALKVQVAGLQGQLAGKLDVKCVEVVQVVVRPGYVYQNSDGSLSIYKAFDEFDPAIDPAPNRLMQVAAGC